MKDDLQRVPIPGERDAEARALAVIRAAFERRAPVPRSPRRLRPALALAVAAAVVAAALSPPGRAVIDELREVVGVERAQPALFSLPAEGTLLVASDAGVWVVREDGSKRLLGGYREASWSPFGRFVVAARENELAALEPDGDVRWTLARPGARSPRWAGTTTDTRIAYVDRTGVRVVAGDGTGDRLLARSAGGPVAWRPGEGYVLAYTTRDALRVVDTETGRRVWQAPRPAGGAAAVAWSSAGERVLVLTRRALWVYDGASGRLVDRNDPAEGWPNVAAAFRPGSTEVAVARIHGAQSTVFRLGDGATLFNGTGELRDVEWSPDGRWLAVTWPTADQWVFVRADGSRRIRAVANVAEQFRAASVLRFEGWCCGR